MKFLKRYYSELFSLCLFFPLVVFGMPLGVMGGLVITSFLVFFTAILFRNYQITAFSALLLIPTLIVKSFASFPDIGSMVLGFFISVTFYLFCFSVLRKKNWAWMWYCVIWLWSFLLFSTIAFDVLKICLIFAVFYLIAYIFFPLVIGVVFEKHVPLHFFALLFSALLLEMFWVVRIFPLGTLLGPTVVMVCFYFFSRVYRGYQLGSPFHYYIRPVTFTFLSLLVILLTAINSVF